MTITLNLPDELVVRLKETAERNHVGIDALARDGIEHAITTATSADPVRRDANSLEKVHEILRNAGFVPPDDAEVERLKEERILRKYGSISSTHSAGSNAT